MWKPEVIIAIIVGLTTLATGIYQLRQKASTSLVELLREQIKTCAEQCERVAKDNLVCNADRIRLEDEVSVLFRRIVLLEHQEAHATAAASRVVAEAQATAAALLATAVSEAKRLIVEQKNKPDPV